MIESTPFTVEFLFFLWNFCKNKITSVKCFLDMCQKLLTQKNFWVTDYSSINTDIVNLFYASHSFFL